MRFTLTFDMDNAAFDSADEVSLILLKVRQQFENGCEGAFIADSNGNKVGEWAVAK